MQHVFPAVEGPGVIQHPPGETKEIIQGRIRALERIGLLFRRHPADLAQGGDIGPGLVGPVRVAGTLDEDAQTAHLIRVGKVVDVFPLKLRRPVNRQGVILLGQHGQMAVIHPLIALLEHALNRATRLNHILGYARQGPVRPARFNHDRGEIADLDAIMLPAEIKIPADLETRGRVCRVQLVRGKRLAGSIVLQAAVLGKPGLAGEFLGCFEIVRAWGVIAWGADVEAHFRKLELLKIAGRHKGLYLVHIAQPQGLAGRKLRLSVLILPHPFQDGLPSHGAPLILGPTRPGPGQ